MSTSSLTQQTDLLRERVDALHESDKRTADCLDALIERHEQSRDLWSRIAAISEASGDLDKGQHDLLQGAQARGVRVLHRCLLRLFRDKSTVGAPVGSGLGEAA